MSKRAPPPVREALEALLAKQEWTQKQLAKKLGVSLLSVWRLINGRQKVTVDMALKLEKVSGIRADDWLLAQTSHDLWQARKGKHK